MFSGKTERLLNRLERAKLAKKKIIVFKPDVDNRYHSKNVVSHKKNKINAVPIRDAEEILTLSKDFQVIGVDEVQFFNEKLVTICTNLANQGKIIIVAGLDMDFSGNPFGVMPKLLAVAEKIKKVRAVCMNCGGLASYSFRKNNDKKLIQIGQKTEYKALCRDCFKNTL